MKSTRRKFVADAALGTLALSLGRTRSAAASPDRRPAMEQIRRRALGFVESMRLTAPPYGRYRYSAAVSEPTLYSSSYAAMTRHLYGDLASLSASRRQEWIDDLQSHQDDDGLFRDPLIFGQGWYQGDPDWCGRRHLSCHVVTALACLGAVARKPLRFLDPFLEPGALVRWLESRRWRDQADYVGNEVLNLGTLMQYARDFQQHQRCRDAVRVMLDWMATHHLDPQTGLWGDLKVEKPKELSRAVQAAYHLWLLYFFDGAMIPHPDRAVDHILKTQNAAGGFGQGVHNSRNPLNSSACEDIDSIDPLVRLAMARSYRRADIRRALDKGLARVLVNQNPDGGFVFMRDVAFTYGHPALASGKDQSAMFPTWFRTLTLAYLGQALPDSVVGACDWQFCNCPGLQFWTKALH